jgi:hypothetical protein
LDLPQLLRHKSYVYGQAHRMDPKLCQVIVTQDMDMDRLIPIRGVKKEPVGPDAKDCRHSLTLAKPPAFRKPHFLCPSWRLWCDASACGPKPAGRRPTSERRHHQRRVGPK